MKKIKHGRLCTAYIGGNFEHLTRTGPIDSSVRLIVSQRVGDYLFNGKDLHPYVEFWLNQHIGTEGDRWGYSPDNDLSRNMTTLHCRICFKYYTDLKKFVGFIKHNLEISQKKSYPIIFVDNQA